CARDVWGRGLDYW
nr:immunoglobulin heavy chain junction region [Macaca mulatta]MOW45562.1 immunoglobulin heavy chain junction region [Macaca mulatta]MOW45592.1 immunoglobulin heavy chain junction region [Macaca mulatta]MOW45719.1 immunoglobulin heavy chain junction region [Macaca mulatta]MOW45728.1 immunoglobulin heavy chain junction region [Macaca mulatta]